MFMVFGDHAINFDLVTRLYEETPGTVRIYMGTGSLVFDGVTIDQILTAQAAGQAKVQAGAVHPAPPLQRQILPDEPAPKHFDDGSKRGLGRGNDLQALNSIGRK